MNSHGQRPHYIVFVRPPYASRSRLWKFFHEVMDWAIALAIVLLLWGAAWVVLGVFGGDGVGVGGGG